MNSAGFAKLKINKGNTTKKFKCYNEKNWALKTLLHKIKLAELGKYFLYYLNI